MGRLSNKLIKNMSIDEVMEYAIKHPAESGRISRVLANASIECGKVSIQYYTSNVFKPNPRKVTIDLE